MLKTNFDLVDMSDVVLLFKISENLLESKAVKAPYFEQKYMQGCGHILIIVS